ncbi:DUF116 domain-containing protein [Mesoterricola sediminis]|uniref:DUF116 domain-containing protein n=1 Tax=Mesoterricola sediminis TaxID=2927980 RepID=A0AA48H6E5_9BACT|nr:DUF116 domain-containing protein [Mesoterricola sediminis]BDU76828.1 hypothetical protein METESE_17860 [Mesoterricola sediminis]
MGPSAPSSGNRRLFIAVRRGVPLGLAALLLIFSLLEPVSTRSFQGWMVLGAALLFGEAWPTFKRGRTYLKARPAIVRWDGGWVYALRPLFRRLGLEEAWILGFCDWNNLKVAEAFRERKARKALVLLPHCIQMARCKADVVTDLSTCYACGLCAVGDLLPLRLQQGWDVRLSNRSHKAYRDARAFGPDLIVAVSCSDRLLKGIVKLPEVPCYVIPLALPHGMCVDTSFSVPDLMTAMAGLVEPRTAPDGGRVLPLRQEGIA